MIRVSTTWSSYALGYAMFKNDNADEMKSLIEKVRQEALALDDVQTVIVIAKNIDQDDVAYDDLILVERGE